MPKVFSSSPIFVDLFYGVVVGSAVALLSWKDKWSLLLEIVWILAVLEDWFLYYRHVVDEESKKVTYSFNSLITEFLILLSWFLGFEALKEEEYHARFFLCFSAFYVLKVVAGVTFYYKHGQLFSRRMLYDSFWLVLPLAALFITHCQKGLDFWAQYWILAGVTAIVLIIWWAVTTISPPEKM